MVVASVVVTPVLLLGRACRVNRVTLAPSKMLAERKARGLLVQTCNEILLLISDSKVREVRYAKFCNGVTKRVQFNEGGEDCLALLQRRVGTDAEFWITGIEGIRIRFALAEVVAFG